MNVEASRTLGRYEVKRLARPLGLAAHCLLVVPPEGAINEDDIILFTRAREVCCEFGGIPLRELTPDQIKRALSKFRINGLIHTQGLQSSDNNGFVPSYQLTTVGENVLKSETNRNILLHPPERSWKNPLKTFNYYLDDLKSIMP